MCFSFQEIAKTGLLQRVLNRDTSLVYWNIRQEGKEL